VVVQARTKIMRKNCFDSSAV